MKHFFTMAIFGIVLGLSAQEAIHTCGGEATGEAGSVSYSLGQVFYYTHSGTSGSIHEGVQQPYVLSLVIGVDQPGVILGMSVFPNPTSDFLTLKIANEEIQSKRWTTALVDVNGRIIKQQIIVAKETSIDFSDLHPATYFLKVYNEEEEIKVFKIIKN